MDPKAAFVLEQYESIDNVFVVTKGRQDEH